MSDFRKCAKIFLAYNIKNDHVTIGIFLKLYYVLEPLVVSLINIKK